MAGDLTEPTFKVSQVGEWGWKAHVPPWGACTLHRGVLCRMLAAAPATAPQATDAACCCHSLLPPWQEEMAKAGLDMVYRDFCAHLLIPLNECRRKTWYAPWKCGHERHEYEKCQYADYKRRVLLAAQKQQ